MEIARYLGCDYYVNVQSLSEIPSRYKAFVCIKPDLNEEELTSLAQRGIVIWDIIDRMPPPCEAISMLIAGTTMIKRLVEGMAPVYVIPQHHCNYSDIPNTWRRRNPVWIGQYNWYPPEIDFDHEAYDSRRMNDIAVGEIYRSTGIGLNLRSCVGDAYLHTLFNAGIKLINCIGYGVPSVSMREPAYVEHGEGCTIYVSTAQCGSVVKNLIEDDSLYAHIKENCTKRAVEFHIANIASLYRRMFEEI